MGRCCRVISKKMVRRDSLSIIICVKLWGQSAYILAKFLLGANLAVRRGLSFDTGEVQVRVLARGLFCSGL
jgi:hypothetical protein